MPSRYKRQKELFTLKSKGKCSGITRIPPLSRLSATGKCSGFSSLRMSRLPLLKLLRACNRRFPQIFSMERLSLQEILRLQRFHKEEDLQTGTIVLELIPRASQNNLSKIIMRLNSENFRIYQTEVYDLFENLTRITFSQIQIDTNLNDSLFTFTPPSGVEILSPPTVPLPQR